MNHAMDHYRAILDTQACWATWWQVYDAWLNGEATTKELEQARTEYMDARAVHALYHDMKQNGAEYALNHHACF